MLESLFNKVAGLQECNSIEKRLQHTPHKHSNHTAASTIKVHKHEKNYPMRTIASTVGTPLLGIFKYLVNRVQHTLNKGTNRLINYGSFINFIRIFSLDA